MTSKKKKFKIPQQNSQAEVGENSQSCIQPNFQETQVREKKQEKISTRVKQFIVSCHSRMKPLGHKDQNTQDFFVISNI